MPLPDDEGRKQEINEVIVKVIGVVIAVVLIVGIGTWLTVRSLGLSDVSSTLGTQPVEPVTPLPTTALPEPGGSSATPGASGSSYPDSLNPSFVPPPSADALGLYLSATPVFVKPMDKIYLTGQWAGHDAVGLQVQRMEAGQWVNFGVQVDTQVGRFSTFVMTSRNGDNKFRVVDPQTKMTSNVVTVTVD